MKQLNIYEVDYFTVNGKKRETVKAEQVQAENIAAVYADKLAKGEKDFSVYPFATLTNGESIMELADYTVRQWYEWEIRNEYAAESVLQQLRNGDTEDDKSTVMLAIVEKLTENPASYMSDLFLYAFKTIKNARRNLAHKREMEYNPVCLFCNPFTVRETVPTCAELDELIKQAREQAGLTPEQADAERTHGLGLETAAIIELLCVTKHAYYCRLYGAHYKILTTAAELDEGGKIFAKAGISKEDLQAAIEVYKKRARA